MNNLDFSIALNDLTAHAASHGVTVTAAQGKLLSRYAALLLEWNKKINLISRKDEERVFTKHILHSVSVAFFHSFKPAERVLDIGTGGGLPAIPLAILFPESLFLGIDSVGKKVAACNDMIAALDLKNITAKKLRVEELKRVQFNTAVSRAVASMPELCKWVRPLLSQNGSLICLKGGELQTELDEALILAAESLSFPEHIDTHSIEFLGDDFKEKFVVVAT
ncbi:MAG: 16S rRNA (guanine(527)-N(7))-methyltransferase RsmG [Rhizobacter sp.]|nr:16S rRNA (guanine(527)-N(7))-methyltransferase RsmG [Chlorobiales bacterium]